ncbi:lytic transglycosylase domain-containing protein [Spirosoma rigui]|uniref:lytic transglycosylase domain-containing protein n=1 Tax=Spirosoma rigui TaxID=564064 RepID=UPI0009B05578|nr:lytic transglycosylase domain-containing protein [Spirosoma rigui]
MTITHLFLLTAGMIVASTSHAPPAWLHPSVVEAPYPSLTDTYPLGLPPVHFCGESVPVHEGVIARRLMSALVSRSVHSQTLYRIRRRAAAFFPIIEPILAYHQIPADFKYLPLVESALLGFAVSPRGATGYWQFMPATARELGLVIRPGYDERQDLVKSTHAACRYLTYLHNRLGSWTLAAAAYNNGIGALLANIRRQGQRDYYYLRLNAETGKYLYRILAFKELFSNYRSYPSLISDELMAIISEPMSEAPNQNTNDTEAILPETIVDEAVQSAIKTPAPESRNLAKGQSENIPLPNAADVFLGGIKARLVESADVMLGQVWVFHLTRKGMANDKEVDEGDILYAVVEDIDRKHNKLYLRADKLYSPADKQTYNLALVAIDASTGRIGVNLADIDQVKAGWILTWKGL